MDRLEYARKWRAENREKSNAYSRKWAKANPEKVKARNSKSKAYRQARQYWSHIKRVYGCTREQWEEMYRVQGGMCAICGTSDFSKEPGKRPVLDHCHNTGKIRGLLCSPCNTGLGAFKDSCLLLDMAKEYLGG